jgi:hypothetical protein
MQLGHLVNLTMGEKELLGEQDVDVVREGVRYVRTQLSCILFIMLTTICFVHCGPSSGHKNMYRGKLYTV